MALNVSRRRFIWAGAAGSLVTVAARPGRLLAQTPKAVWRYVAFGARNTIFATPAPEFARRVREATNGEVRVDFVGGPEVISPFQAVEAVSKGVFHIAITSSNFYATSLPEAISILSGHTLPMSAVRESGAFAFLDELHRTKLQVRLLGCPMSGAGYIVISKAPLKALEDFRGKKFRSLPLYDPIFKALGAATVTTPPGEAYNALERGVVEGLGWTEIGIEEYRFYEQAKFIAQPSFYSMRANHVVNLAAWNALPPALQKAVEEASLATDAWGEKFGADQRAKERAAMAAKGAQDVVLPEADAKKLRQIAEEGMWQTITRTAPQNAPKLQELFTKAAALKG